LQPGIQWADIKLNVALRNVSLCEYTVD